MTNMPATMKMEYKIGINAPLVRREAKTLMVEGDRCANTIVIEVMDGLEPADLAGCSVSAIMKRSDGARPFVHGTVEGNVVTVCLNESFYAVPGGYELLVRLTHTDGTKRVILWLNGWINDEGQGDLIDTENVVPALEDLLAQIDAMEQATQSATAAAQTATQAAADATNTANAAATSAQATAEAAATQAVEIATTKGDEAVRIATEQVEAQNQAIAKIATDLLTKAPAIECEASGTLVTVTDAAAQPAVQLVTHIEPVQEGEGDPSPENVRPISGWDAASMTRAGKNIFHAGNMSFKTRKRVDFDPPLRPGTYTLSAVVDSEDTDATGCSFFFMDNSEMRGELTRGNRASATVVASVPITFICFYASRNHALSQSDNCTWTDVQLELGSTATAYEPYQGQTLTADLPETVYGGTQDWGTGVLTVTHGNIAEYAGEAVGDDWISSTGELSDGAQVVYRLADPYTIQLTPQQLSMLRGTNNLWSDTGDTDLVYVADTQKYVKRIIEEALQNATTEE